MNDRRPLRRRPPREPGPRLLPVLLALVMLGVALGAGGKLFFQFLHHRARPVAPIAVSTPDYAVLPVRPTRLAPIPTPKGTWFLARPPGLFAGSQASPSNRARPVRPPAVTPGLPTPPPRLLPRPLVRASPRGGAALPTFARTPRSWSEAVPEASIPPLPRSTPPPIPSSATPSERNGERGAVTRVPPSGPSRLVRRYLAALIHGDERTAYRMLGALPGDPHLGLTEESFINTSARISSLSTAPEGAGTVVRAEIETAGGLYFATYHLRRQNGRYLITSHEFIKL